MMGMKQKWEDWWLAFRANSVTGLRDTISLFLESSDESNEKCYVGQKCCVCIVFIQLTNNEVCVMMSKGVVQKISYRRSKRSTKTRKFYIAGNGADGRRVEEAITTATSKQEERFGHWAQAYSMTSKSSAGSRRGQ
jgi:hypothetical protein